MTLYDMNKQICSQMEQPTEERIEEFKKEIDNWYSKKQSGYLMLLCRDLNHYTVFRWQNRCDEYLFDLVFECLDNIGSFKSLICNENDIEFWFIDKDNEAHVAYLFPYDNGVINFGG